MGYKVIITGTTGMVGKGVLLECIDHEKIDQILIVNRNTAGIHHKKLKEILIPDFFDLSGLKDHWKDYDACFFCLGITSLGQSEDSYSKITCDLTLNFAQNFYDQNQNGIFCYVSGAGTDSSEKGRSMWARVKGRTENGLLNMGFKGAYMFRPGYIQPLRGIKSKTKWYALLYLIFKPIYLLLKHFPATATNTTNMGLAMINILSGNYQKKILENTDINELAQKNIENPN
ncbi:epimerase [Lutimonas zeaxanthinifaciens]|uniref:epimerase n=1 Tax=Lutimonas zeaxanthinifaciens TaxID=3060215 RepID=UPI00265D4F07|nr:epimerase [Lutimonas sp. YSD2104]WKK65584.1 epimerase [Lutimonas sp. YSD2104]